MYLIYKLFYLADSNALVNRAVELLPRAKSEALKTLESELEKEGMVAEKLVNDGKTKIVSNQSHI